MKLGLLLLSLCCFAKTKAMTSIDTAFKLKYQIGIGATYSSVQNKKIVHPDVLYAPKFGLNIDGRMQVLPYMSIGLKQIFSVNNSNFNYPGFGGIKRKVRYFSVNYEHLFNIKLKPKRLEFICGLVFGIAQGTISYEATAGGLLNLLLPKQRIAQINTGNVLGFQYGIKHGMLRVTGAGRIFPLFDKKQFQKNISPYTVNLMYIYEI